jgi:hypothetical protein
VEKSVGTDTLGKDYAPLYKAVNMKLFALVLQLCCFWEVKLGKLEVGRFCPNFWLAQKWRLAWLTLE